MQHFLTYVAAMNPEKIEALLVSGRTHLGFKVVAHPLKEQVHSLEVFLHLGPLMDKQVTAVT